MTSQPGQQGITKQILRNISKNTDNCTMKFGQLIQLIEHSKSKKNV